MNTSVATTSSRRLTRHTLRGFVPAVVTPFAAAMSRKHEFEADAYASAQANGQDLANALVKLHEDNAGTLTPDPLYARFYYSHPPAAERLAALKLA